MAMPRPRVPGGQIRITHIGCPVMMAGAVMMCGDRRPRRLMWGCLRPKYSPTPPKNPRIGKDKSFWVLQNYARDCYSIFQLASQHISQPPECPRFDFSTSTSNNLLLNPYREIVGRGITYIYTHTEIKNTLMRKVRKRWWWRQQRVDV